MKRFLLAALFVLGAGTARAELYDGSQPLGAGDPGVPTGNLDRAIFDIGNVNGYVYLCAEYMDNGRFWVVTGHAEIDSGPHTGYWE